MAGESSERMAAASADQSPPAKGDLGKHAAAEDMEIDLLPEHPPATAGDLV